MRNALFLLIASLNICGFTVKAETTVCVHGFLGTAKSMRYVNLALSNCNQNVILYEYETKTKFIAEHACELSVYLQQIAAKRPGQPINFVAHSIGSIVLRAALNCPGCPEEAKIGKAILIAPPNQGSGLGRKFRNFFPVQMVMGNRSGWELLNYGPYEMCQFGVFPETMQVLVLAGSCGNTLFFRSPNDGFLTVRETLLNSPNYHFKIFRLSHGGLLKYPSSLSYIRQFITH